MLMRLTHFKTIPPLPWEMSSSKPVPSAKKAGDRWFKNTAHTAHNVICVPRVGGRNDMNTLPIDFSTVSWERE